MVPGEDEVGAPPRDTTVVGWLVLVGGLLWMLSVGWRADVYWGFFLAEPSCLAAGTCTREDLGQHQQEAWAALGPPTLLAVVGAALVLGGLVGSGGRLVDRDRGAWWLLHRAVFVTVGVGVVAVIPLAGAAVVSPPLGAAGLAVVLVLLGVALHAALRPRRPRPDPGVSEGRPTR
ncbi:hypothetical protein KMZ32_14805 [Phycicoccus sp. MAQZ13P-2]|uniref:hypothetical protein n=1 Tax=Phycicoccus mangrovi TaxID=2840470 RepID=UPI001BFFF0A1|nr:hypothetical protein [Phycicoccus mangrovi]MBT9255631.1 hypothetical protein [Phycicoccus mangrovi]MBT9275345.1 hypothetical protein [Phycicoccus mangrovi]